MNDSHTEFLTPCYRNGQSQLHYYRDDRGSQCVADERVFCQCVQNDLVQIHTVTACSGCGLGYRPRDMRGMSDDALDSQKLYCIDCFAEIVNRSVEDCLSDDALKAAWDAARYYGGFAGVGPDSDYAWAFKEAGGTTNEKESAYIAGCLCRMMGYGWKA